MPVHSKHPQYAAARKKWERIRACVAGEDTIKEGKQVYLPKPDPDNTSVANGKRFVGYVARAIFHNITGRTLEGLTGQVFAVDPVPTVPDDFDYIVEDIDGGGVTATQQSKLALESIIQFSRGGLLVDYPDVAEPATKEDAEQNGIRPRVMFIDPFRIINWRTTARNGKTILSLVVIEEPYEVAGSDDGFTCETKTRYRVLRLIDNVYNVELWEIASQGTDYVKARSFIPKNGDGKDWDELTFTFIGPATNDPTIQKPLLDDISCLNLGHYRNSADYEDSVYRVGQPQPWASGLTETWIEEVYPDKKIKFGAATCILLPVGGQFGIEQVEPNTMAKEAMADKELQMIALGAKIVEPKAVQKTATEVGQDASNVTSVLATATKNVTAAYGRALAWAAAYANIEYEEEEPPLFELNTDFAISRMSSQDRAQLLAEWQAGGIVDEEYRFNLRKGGVAYLDDEKYQELKEEDDAKLLGMVQQTLAGPKVPGQPGKEDLPGPVPPKAGAPAATA